MTIIADKYIPFLFEAVRKEWPDVDIYPMEPEQIDHSAVHDADVLIVRTRTKVDESLLSGTRVRLVCTATIGYDHIDTAYCESHGIRWTACPGCNAQAVCDYVEEALNETVLQNSGLTIGVVGVGHVGTLVAKMAERRGLKVLLNDPPKHIGVSLDEIAQQCDIITFHVPLDNTTRHMCDAAFLDRCKAHTLIINAARGGVVDEKALLNSGHPFILDTWENEPNIHPDVLRQARLASMHIAGYSVQGKRNATQKCLDFLSCQNDYLIGGIYHLPKIDISEYRYADKGTKKGDSAPGWLSRVSESLKAQPTAFESLRKSYPLRGE